MPTAPSPFLPHLGRRHRRRPLAALAVALLLLGSALGAQERALPTDSFPAPLRSVSAIVAPRYIAEDRRDAFGEASRVLGALRIRRGMAVADIGAGEGYFVERLVSRVGAQGQVLAVDIEPSYLALLRARVARSGWSNVQVIDGLPQDPRLPADGVDAALMVHMYHEVTQPFGLLYHLAFALRVDGLVGVVDAEAPTDRHGTPSRLLRCEFEAMRYRYVRRARLEDGAYLMIFRAPEAARRLDTAADVRSAVAEADCRA